MNPRAWLRVALAGLSLAGVSCRPTPPDEGDYVSRLTSARTVKDQEFQKASNSPIPKTRAAEMLPLPYYPIDPAYNVPASLKVSTDQTVLQMSTSTGVPRRYRRAGTLEFTLNGQPLTLTAFVEAGASNLNSLFVPFRDLTSTSDTYPGGRYLDLERTRTGYYELDFNRAYNPYCYYNISYECPLPPAENHLKIAVPVGEKIRPSETS